MAVGISCHDVKIEFFLEKRESASSSSSTTGATRRLMYGRLRKCVIVIMLLAGMLEILAHESLVQRVHAFDVLVVEETLGGEEARPIEQVEVEIDRVQVDVELRVHELGVVRVVHVRHDVKEIAQDATHHRVVLAARRRELIAHLSRELRLVAEQLGRVR